jgi:hypothetical protein
MEISHGKKFYNAAGGPYIGTIIDMVDMPNVTKVYNGVAKVVNQIRVVWVLAQLNGAPYLDPEGQPFTVTGFYTASQAENSSLTKILTQILNAAPPMLSSTEQLEQLLIGRSNSLYLTQTPNAKKAGEFFTNVAAVSPLPPNVAPPAAPVGFVRFKNRPKTQAGPNPGQQTQTFAQNPASNAGVPAVNLNGPAVSTASGPEAF